MRYHRMPPIRRLRPRAGRRRAARRQARAARARDRGARRARPAAARAAASAAIAARIVALPSFAAARTMLLTLPFRSEWDTRPLVAARARPRARRVALPRVDARRAHARRCTASPISARDVAPGYRGIPEPLRALRASSTRADDRLGARSRRRVRRRAGAAWATAAATTTGCCRCCRRTRRASPARSSCRSSTRVPAAPHDLTVDAIVTETRVVDLGIASELIHDARSAQYGIQ